MGTADNFLRWKQDLWNETRVQDIVLLGYLSLLCQRKRRYKVEPEAEESNHSELDRCVVRVLDFFKERQDKETKKYFFYTKSQVVLSAARAVRQSNDATRYTVLEVKVEDDLIRVLSMRYRLERQSYEEGLVDFEAQLSKIDGRL